MSWQIVLDLNADDPSAPAEALERANAAGVWVDGVEKFEEGVKLLKSGKADAIVSARDTRRVIRSALHHLDHVVINRPGKNGAMRPRGIFPPIALELPNIYDGRFILCDAGGQVSPDPIELYCDGLFGAIMAREYLGIRRPVVGILAIGEEDAKLTMIDQEVRRLLEEHERNSRSDLGVLGAVEPKEVMNGGVDVVVCTGREGNLMLKSFEAGVVTMQAVLRQEFRRGLLSWVAGLAVKGIGWRSFRRVKKRLDPRYFAGGIVAGLSHPVVICHGRSSADDIVWAIRRAQSYLEHDLAAKLRDGLLASLAHHHPEWLPAK